jgi:HPt (histidine-containing phosphotransfer) domain-containing protein
MIDTMQVPNEARQKYLDRRKQDIIACHDALSRQDFQFLERLGHQIKGNAITFGFNEFTSIAIEMEKAAKSKSLASLTTLVQQFESAVNKAHI